MLDILRQIEAIFHRFNTAHNEPLMQKSIPFDSVWKVARRWWMNYYRNHKLSFRSIFFFFVTSNILFFYLRQFHRTNKLHTVLTYGRIHEKFAQVATRKKVNKRELNWMIRFIDHTPVLSHRWNRSVSISVLIVCVQVNLKFVEFKRNDSEYLYPNSIICILPMDEKNPWTLL